MIRTLSILGLIAAVMLTTMLAGCAASQTKPYGLTGQQVRQVNDKQRPI